MKRTRSLAAQLSRCFFALATLAVLALGYVGVANAACTNKGCVMAGPRLVSLNTAQGALTGPVLSSLLGTGVNLNAIDWQMLAGGEISVAQMLNLLKVPANVSTPDDVLASQNINLLNILNAAAGATVGNNAANVSAQLNSIALAPNIPLPNIVLGELIKITGTPTNTTINALDLVTGAIQLYNSKHVVTTTPVGVNLASFPLLTGLSALTLQAQVIEPPVYHCGVFGTQFHSAAIRVKLNLTLLAKTVSNSISLLGLNIASSSVTLVPALSLYVEVARATGTIGTIDAVNKALHVDVTPGVADLYLGTINDTLFFQRTRQLAYSDFTPVKLADVAINLVGGLLQLRAEANVRSQAHGVSTLGGMDFAKPYPKTLTVSSSSSSATNLVTSLLNNLQVTLNVSVNTALVNLGDLITALGPLLGGVLQPILTPIATGVLDPVLDLVGLKLGQAVVSAYGVFTFCAVDGTVYNDVNHTSMRENGELGTGVALYAKLVDLSNPTAVAFTATVNPTTGAFNFADVVDASYSLRIDNNDTTSDVIATKPNGWIPLEQPTLMRAVTIATTDIAGQIFGMYNGSTLAGRVFVDTGVGGGGIANNVVRDGTEPSLPGAVVSATDTAGTTTYDTTTAGDDGAYTLWIPAAAGATTLKVTETNPASYVSIGANVGTSGGTYARATDTVTFTNVLGNQYTGVNFADVPATQFDTDGRQVVLPGTVAFYPHAFVAGTAGQITFTTTAPSANGWTREIFRDSNCNRAIDTGENQIVAAVAVAASDKVCLIIKIAVPPTAAFNDQYPVAVGASFAYANSAIVDTLARNDLTMVGTASGAGLYLSKTVDKASAKSGDVLTYTITYTNNSTAPLSQLKIFDATPSYTVFTSAACGTLGATLTACTVTTKPAVAAAGSLEWTMTGSLASGAVGTVTFQVTVQ